MRKNTLKIIILLVVCFIIVPVGIFIFNNNYKIQWNIKTPIIKKGGIEDIIKRSGFQNAEANLIIDALIRKGVKKGEIININKISDNEANITTGYDCGDLCGSGHFYKARKINDKWETEQLPGMWIS
jgi:hypothetical protein